MGLFDAWKKKKKEGFTAPMSGQVVPLEQVPDPTFAQKMLGDGFAIEPTEGTVVSPVSGVVEAAFPTGHAFGLRAEDGTELLIHIGIDTVELNGDGFEVMVKQGDSVRQGDVLVKVDLEKIKKAGKLTVSPVIFTGGNRVDNVPYGTITRGDLMEIKIS